MKNKIFIAIFTWLSISTTTFGQSFDYEAPLIRLKTGLPSIFAVEGVRQIHEGDEEAVLNIIVNVKKGKIESVSKDGGHWIITVRTSGKEASTYMVKDTQFKIIGEESKKVTINAIHWKDGN